MIYRPNFMNKNTPRGIWSGFAGKKLFIITSILLLAAACSKKSAAPVTQNQPEPVAGQSSVATSTADGQPLILKVYNDPSGAFKINYTSNFAVLSASAIQHPAKGQDTSVCGLGSPAASVCFLFSTKGYEATNLASAAVYVKKLLASVGLSQCATFDPSITSGAPGSGPGSPIVINGVTFVTATASDAAAGNFYETHYARGFYGGTCYEVDETVHSTNVQNYDPPRQEFDHAQVWQQLDAVRGGFRFTK
jgi:hypothetical protein